MKQKTQIFKSKILLAILGIVFVSAGCGGGGTASQRIVLNFWDPFITTAQIQPLISAYQQKYPNVQVVFTQKDINTYPQDLINALASGSGPDIFAINNSWLPQYINKISPATSTILSYTNYKNTFVDVAVKDFTLNQKVYGVPLSVDSLGLYYNKDILGSAGIATPPKTWDELSQDVQKIKRADQTGYFTLSGLAAGTNANVNRAVDILYLFMLQKGAAPFSTDGTRPVFANAVTQNGQSDNPGLDGLNYYTSFANPASPNYNWNARSDYSIDAFANGRAAFLISYSFTLASLRQKNPNLNFDVAPMPQPNLTQPAVNFANYWGEVVSKQSKSPNTAWNFINFITSKSSLDQYYAKNKVPSSRLDLISLQVQDPDIGVFANSDLTAKSFYKPDQVKMDGIFGQMIDNVILNGMAAQQALQQGQQQAATLVNQ
ncbi:MAG: sugar ABC transporter substrate-binding protein [Candidatus Doudnabacteria bacterium]|nr:sugar ABC transporter substrate-binding protein [Candidatus Doudnabacteria bacterium]